MGKAAKQAWKKQQQPTSTYDKQKEAAVPMDPDKHMLVRVADEVNNLSQAVEANKVRSFTGDYEFLSTLHKSRVVLPGEGVTEDDFLGYPTAEHALQAAKTTDAAARDSIRSCKEPLEAKRMGAKIAYDREDWKTRSLAVMEAILRDKFRRHKSLRVSLLETGYKDLVNENDYNDQFWGYVKGKGGSNQLGVLLSKVRADERDGIATLMWAKQIFEAVPDSKVRLDVEVTKDGQRVDAACVSLERRSIITFGKLKENDVPMDHPSISRQHALLVVSSKYGPLLVDLEAPNGTFIDGRRLEPFKGAKLTEEMEVSFGHSTRRYRFHVDSAFDTKKQAKLYEILEDPSKIAAEKGDLGVFVSNLPKDVTEDEVQKFFSNCGTVLQVVLPRNKETKQPRGFAIVIFGTEAAVVNALKLDKDPFRENVIGSDKVHIKRNKPQPKADGGSAGARGGKDGKQEHRRHDQGSAPPASHAPAATREGSRPVSAPPPDGPDPKRNGGDRRSDHQREQQLDRDDRRRGSRVHRDDRDRDRKHSTRSRSRDRRRARSRSHSEERRRSRRHDSSKRDRSRSRDRAARKRSRRQEASSSSSSSSSARSSSSSSSSASSRGR